MDSTVVVVVLLFVFTICSSFDGNKGYAPPSSPPTTSPPSKLSKPVEIVPLGKIDPTYFAAVGTNARASIQKYVMEYRDQSESVAITDAIMRHSQEYNVNPKLVTALIRRESTFNPQAVSKSGAIGLGQLLPSTCKTTGVTNPYDINDNAKGTVRYMKYLLDKFKSYSNQVSFALAGYLEGPNAVMRNNGYKSTTAEYIRDIFNIYNNI